MQVVSLDRYRASEAAARYETQQAEARSFAEALAANELKQRVSILGALTGAAADLRGVSSGHCPKVVAQPLAECLAACLDHESTMAVLIDALRHEGGEHMAALRRAIADSFVLDTAEAITEVELGLV